MRIKVGLAAFVLACGNGCGGSVQPGDSANRSGAAVDALTLPGRYALLSRVLEHPVPHFTLPSDQAPDSGETPDGGQAPDAGQPREGALPPGWSPPSGCVENPDVGTCVGLTSFALSAPRSVSQPPLCPNGGPLYPCECFGGTTVDGNGAFMQGSMNTDVGSEAGEFWRIFDGSGNELGETGTGWYGELLLGMKGGFQGFSFSGGGGEAFPSYVAFDEQGHSLASKDMGMLSGNDDALDAAAVPGGGIVAAWSQPPMHQPPGDGIFLQRFGPDGQAAFSPVLLSRPTASVVKVAINPAGQALVMWTGDLYYGQGTWAAEWVDANGNGLTGVFQVNALRQQVFHLVSLLDGSVAAQDYEGHWTGVFRPLATTMEAPPCWLTAEDGMKLRWIRGGQAYAFVTEDVQPYPNCSQRLRVVSPNGATCWDVDLQVTPGDCNEFLEVGPEGTVVQQLPGTCEDRWWPGLLK